ncbi:MAG: CehA/McbA family metallohydrolase [Opitutus sp.]
MLRSHPNHFVNYIAQAMPVPGRGAALQPALTAGPQAVARLSVTIRDASLGEPTPVRVRITDEDGNPLGLGAAANMPVPAETQLAVPGTVIGLPAQAIAVMHGQNDLAQGYAFQRNGAFYVNGSFDLPMPAGTFLLTLTKGYEYIVERELLSFGPGDHLTRDYRLRRWIDMPAQGWFSADDHIHLRRSPRENPLIRDWIAAEDIHVGVLLQMGDFRATYFSQYAFGSRGRYGDGHHVLSSGQEEPRTDVIGHTISFGAEQFVRFRDDYYSYDRVFDRVHQLGGVSGYAHQAMSFHGYRGMTLDVLTGKIDFLELAQFCVPEGPLALEHYYRLLDLGFKVTALAGSDFPWCGRGRRPGEERVGPQIGDARFYTYTGRPFSFERWLAAVKAGHTFVTTGPMLELEVDGQKPGSSLDVKPGTRLRIVVKAHGHAGDVPLQRLQLIGHGEVLAEAKPGDSGQSPAQLSIEHELTAAHGIWLAARADAGLSQVAHTTPVYVTVDGDGFHNRSKLGDQIERARSHLQEIRELLEPATSEFSRVPGPLSYSGTRERLEQRIVEAERKLEQLRRR